MTNEELKKIFGDKLQACELKLPTYDLPDIFDNVAIYVSRNIDEILVHEAKILPAKEVKCHGVIPMSKEYREKYAKLPPHEQPFNCCIGDYTEMQNDVWIRGMKTNMMHTGEEHMFRASHSIGMPDTYALASCAQDLVDNWIPVYYADSSKPAGWVGYFTTKANAKAALTDKISAKRKKLDLELVELKKTEESIDSML